jgi:hypothetical protein
MGIAGTAAGEWTEARRAWAACGIQLPGMVSCRTSIHVTIEGV